MTKILLVGAGGYAHVYLDFLLDNGNDDIVLEGIVEKYIDNCPRKDDLLSNGIPVYSDMEAFYENHSADLAIICTPTFLHSEQSIYALSKGSYVLCEKPVAPTVRGAEAMLEAEKKYNRWIAIGYQWSYSDAIQAFKKDVISGVLGKPVSFKTAVSWPRNLDYYNRGVGWAGKVQKDGVLILDSIASNACAHYIHNMFFVLGHEMDTSLEAAEVDAVLLRANNIENFDTCSLNIVTSDGTKNYFIASHAAEMKKGPIFEYTFEKAKVIFEDEGEREIKAVFADGREKSYGNPFADVLKKLKDCIYAVNNSTVPICTVKTAIPHTKLINRLYEEFEVSNFPEDIVCFSEEEKRVFVNGLYEKMYEAYDKGEMLNF